MPQIYQIKDFLKDRKNLLVLFILIVFILVHLPALNFLYHQDEYKWAEYVNPALNEPGGIPHPPIGEFIYRNIGSFVGYDNLRAIPFLFGFLNLILLLALGSIIFGKRTAIWIIFLFTISFYSLLASLMIDTDGAVLVSSFLLLAISYYKWKENNFAFKSKWILLVLVSVFLGFLTKESFVLPIFAFGLDFAIEKRIFKSKQKFFKYLLGAFLAAVILIVALFLSKFIFPFFRIEWFFQFLPRFFNFANRGWFQTLIQFTKSLMYLSPLLVIPLFFIDKEIIKKTRPFLFFIATGLFFYLLLFDFSVGALDRYLQFLIVPLCLISGAIFSKALNARTLEKKAKYFLSISIIGILGFLTQFLNHLVPSLHPKSEWVSRILHLEWNFLFPFTGGSGPAGFYVSFLFISLLWIFSTVVLFFAFKYIGFKKMSILTILILGILYNGVFIEEYLFGNINGSPYGLFENAKEFILDRSIKNIVVYNDIGGYDIKKLGVYERRLYAAPQFEDSYEEFFGSFNGHVLYIDIPKIEKDSFYDNYLSLCTNVYEKQDRYIKAQIFECHRQK